MSPDTLRESKTPSLRALKQGPPFGCGPGTVVEPEVRVFVLIIAVWLVLFLALLDEERPGRAAALGAFTVVSVAVLVLTEVLSLLRALDALWLGLSWAVILLVFAIALRKRISTGLARVRAITWTEGWQRLEWLTAGVLGFFLTGTLLSALLYPIVHYDGLTYHMPRVFFWFQNQSVAPHPTPFGPQLFSGTFATYFVLHLKILSGGIDRLANTVQWISYGFAIVAASLISLRLGANRRGQQVVAIATAATPMALLQASTTQNDLTTAVWCLTAVHCALGYIDSPPSRGRATIAWIAWTGAALALAVQSKASAYLVCVPFFVWLTIAAVRRDGLKRASVIGISVLLTALALTSPWYARNAMLLDGDIIGSSAPGMTHILIKDRDVSNVATTALKNSSMMLGTPFESVNELVASVVRTTVGLYGGDLENPRTKEAPSGPYRLDPRIATHDVGPSPMIVLLIATSVAILLASWRRLRRERLWYLACALTAIFLVAGLISWNLFINRVLLGPLLLLVPIVGVAVTEAQRHSRRTVMSIVYLILILAVAWGAFVMLFNTTNRLISPSVLPEGIEARELGYWNTSYADLRFRVLTPELEKPFKAIAAAIEQENVTRIGIHDHVAHFPNYGLLWLLGDRDVRYVRNTLLQDRISTAHFEPQVIVEIIHADDYPDLLQDGTTRGEQLLEPQRAGEYAVMLLYRVP